MAKPGDMRIEDTEWLEVIDEYAKSVTSNIPGEGSELAVKHLVSIGHIRKETIVRHMALLWYPSALHENSGHMAAITDISVRLNVSERTIWSVITRQRQK
jgi:hypothetical protein